MPREATGWSGTVAAAYSPFGWQNFSWNCLKNTVLVELLWEKNTVPAEKRSRTSWFLAELFVLSVSQLDTVLMCMEMLGKLSKFVFFIFWTQNRNNQQNGGYQEAKRPSKRPDLKALTKACSYEWCFSELILFICILLINDIPKNKNRCKKMVPYFIKIKG